MLSMFWGSNGALAHIQKHTCNQPFPKDPEVGKNPVPKDPGQEMWARTLTLKTQGRRCGQEPSPKDPGEELRANFQPLKAQQKKLRANAYLGERKTKG